MAGFPSPAELPQFVPAPFALCLLPACPRRGQGHSLRPPVRPSVRPRAGEEAGCASLGLSAFLPASFRLLFSTYVSFVSAHLCSTAPTPCFLGKELTFCVVKQNTARTTAAATTEAFCCLEGMALAKETYIVKVIVWDPA